MAFDVRFQFVDVYNRPTFRTWGNSNALIDDVLTDVTAIAALFNAVIEGGLVSVTITQKSTNGAFAADAATNVDDNASIKVLAGDGYNYDYNLPMPIAALINPDGTVDLTNAALIALTDVFGGGAGENWTINVRNPTTIASLVSGVLDK